MAVVTTAIANAPVANSTPNADVLNTIDNEILAIRATLGNVLVGSEVYDPASLVDGAGATSTGATVTGAALGDLVIGSFSLDLQGITTTFYVSATNTCKTRFQNETTGTIDLASGTIRYFVIPQAAAALAAKVLTKT